MIVKNVGHSNYITVVVSVEESLGTHFCVVAKM